MWQRVLQAKVLSVPPGLSVKKYLGPGFVSSTSRRMVSTISHASGGWCIDLQRSCLVRYKLVSAILVDAQSWSYRHTFRYILTRMLPTFQRWCGPCNISTDKRYKEPRDGYILVLGDHWSPCGRQHFHVKIWYYMLMLKILESYQRRRYFSFSSSARDVTYWKDLGKSNRSFTRLFLIMHIVSGLSNTVVARIYLGCSV